MGTLATLRVVPGIVGELPICCQRYPEPGRRCTPGQPVSCLHVEYLVEPANVDQWSQFKRYLFPCARCRDELHLHVGSYGYPSLNSFRLTARLTSNWF
jgi:hypothetical protein